jgi:hypothetical protein
VYYKRCFENVMTSPAFIISIVNFVSIMLRKNFNDMTDIIYRNSYNFLNTR